MSTTSTARSTSTGKRRRPSAWSLSKTTMRKYLNSAFARRPTASGCSISTLRRPRQSDASWRSCLGEVERTIEDRLREEYFVLLPEIRRVTEQLEAETRYHVLPICRELEK